MRGKRAIYGGRKPVRHGLYMAALVAAHHNPILRNFYLRLRAAAKPAKLALTATMRKLLSSLTARSKRIYIMLETKTVTNGPIALQLQCVCHETLPWLISFSLGGRRQC
jgi:hypothetical protein